MNVQVYKILEFKGIVKVMEFSFLWRYLNIFYNIFIMWFIGEYIYQILFIYYVDYNFFVGYCEVFFLVVLKYVVLYFLLVGLNFIIYGFIKKYNFFFI